MFRLFEQLSRYEWADAKAHLAQREFHRDIIGSLPIELVVYVFSYLDFTSVYKYQRVSSTWRSTLRDPFMQASRSPSAHVSDLRRSSSNETELVTSLAHRAKGFHAFRSGKPRSCFRFLSRNHSELAALDMWKCALCDYAFAYVTENQTSVRYHDFRRMITKELVGAGQKKIESMGMSSSLLGLRTLSG